MMMDTETDRQTVATIQQCMVVKSMMTRQDKTREDSRWHLAAGVIVAVPFVVGISSIRHVMTSSKYASVTLPQTDRHTCR